MEPRRRLIHASHRMFSDEWLDDVAEVFQATSNGQLSTLQRSCVVGCRDDCPARPGFDWKNHLHESFNQFFLNLRLYWRQASGPVKTGAGRTETQLLRKSIHPLVVDQDGEVEEDFLVHGNFEFFAGGGTDVPDHPGALADEHALVAIVGRQDGGFDVHEWFPLLVFAVFHLVDNHRRRVRNLLVGLQVKLLANEFTDPEFVGDIGHLTEGILRRADGQLTEDRLDNQLDVLVLERGDFDDRSVTSFGRVCTRLGRRDASDTTLRVLQP